MSDAAANPHNAHLDQAVSALWGVGQERAALLAKLRIRTIDDLLLHRPRRYEDRRHFVSVRTLTTEQPALVRGNVAAMGLKRFRGGNKSVFELVLEDGSGRVHCRWWNLPFMENYFNVGDEVLVYGKLSGLKPPTMDHPETEVVETDEESSIHMNRIVPVYPLTEGLPQRWLRGLIRRALEQFEDNIIGPLNVGQASSLSSNLAPARTAENKPSDSSGGLETGKMPVLPSRANAVHMLHCPENLEDVEIARQRLALDEFIELQRNIRKRRARFESKARGLPCRGDNHLMKPFLSRLGFSLTHAQTAVLREIRQDMGGVHPMRRLLQGDVGSGKTVVAACTALMALESGFNVLLMAPTEILAAQHYRNFLRWYEPHGTPVGLLSGSRKVKDLREAGAGASIIVGTHALLESGISVDKLGLVIVDEQHKFGVSQREALLRKGHYPHLLVMTATPIPRTLGLTVYGDLDLSVIDEMPSGRGRVRTFVRSADSLPKVWGFVRNQLQKGRQAYIVYPRVEETSGGNSKAVLKEFEKIQAALAPFQPGLIYGRLRAAEKESVMTQFRSNRIQALVATSLIEVGVDIPNATVMVIENAEQFGLAQLHQLRGRIGRGAHHSHCILVSDARTPEARERLRVLEETSDGFRIAEADLKLRGPGELLGQLQSGAPRFRFADLTQDFALVQRARELVLNSKPAEPHEDSPH